MNRRSLSLRQGERTLDFRVVWDGERCRVIEDGAEQELWLVPWGHGVFGLRSHGGQRLVHWAADGARAYLGLDGETYVFELVDPRLRRRSQAAAQEHNLGAPMPGVLSRLFVEVGQAVEPGQPLFGVEAMKMETIVRTARAGRVKALHAALGTQLEGGAVVVELEELGEVAGARGDEAQE